MSETGLAVTAEEALDGLRRSIAEEVAAIQALVADDDADCISRGLRSERVAAYEHVLRIIEIAKTWDW
jgi:hypothetical protein